jgi:hypothetical protein
MPNALHLATATVLADLLAPRAGTGSGCVYMLCGSVPCRR